MVQQLVRVTHMQTLELLKAPYPPCYMFAGYRMAHGVHMMQCIL